MSVKDRLHKFGVHGRFKYQEWVKSTQVGGDQGWADKEEALKRPWGAIGTVEDIGTGHGTCYLVRTGTAEYWYNQEELEAL